MELSILTNLAATLFMTGVIWLVQVVHYPLFSHVGTSCFARYEELHTQRIAPVVVGPMLLELVTSVWLVVVPPPQWPGWAPWVLAALTTAIWLGTWLLSVPAHNKLDAGFDTAAHRSLVVTNWVRTVGWTARSAILLVLVGNAG